MEKDEVGLFTNKNGTSSKLETAMRDADAALEKFEKIKAVIRAEVLGPLAAAIDNFSGAATALDKAEVAAAVEDPAGGAAVQAATRRVETARRELDRVSGKLKALRAAQAQQGAALVDAHEKLSDEVPAFLKSAVEDFTREWDQAAAAFGRVLARRAALEHQLAAPLRHLAAPQPTSEPTDMASIAGPTQKLDTLLQALSEVKFLGIWDSAVDRMGQPLPALDFAQPIYELRTDEDGLQVGARVCASSFPEGRLRHLVASGFAVSAANSSTAQALSAVEQRLLAIREAKRQRYIDDAARAAASKPDFEVTYAKPFPELTEEERRARMNPHDPRYNQPPQLEKEPLVREVVGGKFEAPEPPIAYPTVEP